MRKILLEFHLISPHKVPTWFCDLGHISLGHVYPGHSAAAFLQFLPCGLAVEMHILSGLPWWRDQYSISMCRSILCLLCISPDARICTVPIFTFFSLAGDFDCYGLKKKKKQHCFIKVLCCFPIFQWSSVTGYLHLVKCFKSCSML